MEHKFESITKPDQLTSDYRKKFSENLLKFIQRTETELQETCTNLGWNFNKLSKGNHEAFITCPFNNGHQVPERTIEKHLESCEWNTLGYTKDCKSLPESALPLDSPSTIKFDEHLQQKVLQKAKMENSDLNIGLDERLIPKTSDRLMSDFTTDERKAMYEYVISNTVGPNIGVDITDLNKTEKSEPANTTMIELLAQERNLKRRRAKHRGVHTNKKSHMEILREIVEQQMEMYKEYVSEKFGIPLSDLTENNLSSNINDKYNKEKSDKRSHSSSSNHRYKEEFEGKLPKDRYDRKSNKYSSDHRYKEGFEGKFSAKEIDRSINDSSSNHRYNKEFERKNSKEEYDKRSNNSSSNYRYNEKYQEKRSRDKYDKRNDHFSSRNKYRERSEEKQPKKFDIVPRDSDKKYSSVNKESKLKDFEKDQDIQNISHEKYDKNEQNNEYHEMRFDEYTFHGTNYHETDFKDQDCTKSKSKERDESNSRKSRKDTSKHKLKDHKKHKKSHKRKKYRSSMSDDERNINSSKHKKKKRRSRS